MEQEKKLYFHGFSMKEGYACEEEPYPNLGVTTNKLFRTMRGDYFVYSEDKIIPKCLEEKMVQLVEDKVSKLQKEIEKTRNLLQPLRQKDFLPDAYVSYTKNMKRYYESIGDYFDREAYKYGFDNYEHLRKEGYSIDLPTLYDKDGEPLKNEDVELVKKYFHIKDFELDKER